MKVNVCIHSLRNPHTHAVQRPRYVCWWWQTRENQVVSISHVDMSPKNKRSPVLHMCMYCTSLIPVCLHRWPGFYILAPPSPMHVKTFTCPWPRLPTASIIRCGWNAVQEIGLLFAEVRKGVYGWIVLILLPLTLKTVRACVSDPLYWLKKFSMKGITLKLTADDGEYTYVARTGACSCTLSVRIVPSIAGISLTGSSFLISHNFTSPFLLPETSSLKPPRCIRTLVIHCLCLRQHLTMAIWGFSRISKIRMAPSPYPAQKTFPAT